MLDTTTEDFDIEKEVQERISLYATDCETEMVEFTIPESRELAEEMYVEDSLFRGIVDYMATKNGGDKLIMNGSWIAEHYGGETLIFVTKNVW